MHLFAKRISSFLVSKSFITQQEHHIYSYCFEILLSSIVFWGLIFIVAFLTGTIHPTILYLFGFCVFRRIAGGYHASTHLRCLLLSIFFHLLFIALLYLAIPNKYINIFLLIFAYCIFLLFAPIDHKNKPFMKETKVNLKYKLVFLMIIYFIIEIILTQLSYTITVFCLSYGCWQAGVAIILAAYQKRKEVSV